MAKQLIGGRGSHSTVLQTHHGLALLRRDSQFRIALPVNMHAAAPRDGSAQPTPSAYMDYTHTGLYRYEVDAAGKSIIPRTPPLATSPLPAYGDPDIRDDRAVLVGEQVHYLRGGSWLSGWW